MELNTLSLNRYNILSNTLFSDYFKSETNMETKIKTIFTHIQKVIDIKNLSLIDKLISFAILNNPAYTKFFNNSLEFQTLHVKFSNEIIISIINDIKSLDKNILFQLYSYYTLKDIVGLFLNLLEIFIGLNINLSLFNQNEIKENIALLMEIFQPTIKKKITINHNGIIKCAVALNVAKS